MGPVANIFKTFAILRGKTLALGVCFVVALLERWPQVCYVKITFTELLTNRFVSTTKKIDEMRCLIPLRIRVRSRNTQPHLTGGPEPLEKEIYEILGSKCEDRLSNPFFEFGTKYHFGSFFVPASPLQFL